MVSREPLEIGVDKAVRMRDIEQLTDAQQDQWIKTVTEACWRDLADFTGGARPATDLAVSVTGPHSDPILGDYYLHRVAAGYVADDLPTACGAYRVHVEGHAEDYRGPSTRPELIAGPDAPSTLADLDKSDRDALRAAYRQKFGVDPWKGTDGS